MTAATNPQIVTLEALIDRALSYGPSTHTTVSGPTWHVSDLNPTQGDALRADVLTCREWCIAPHCRLMCRRRYWVDAHTRETGEHGTAEWWISGWLPPVQDEDGSIMAAGALLESLSEDVRFAAPEVDPLAIPER